VLLTWPDLRVIGLSKQLEGWLGDTGKECWLAAPGIDFIAWFQTNLCWHHGFSSLIACIDRLLRMQ